MTGSVIPAATDLVALNQVKRYIGLQGDDSASDDILQSLISSVSVSVEQYCQRPFILQTFNEAFNGNGHDRYVTKNFPLLWVPQVYINGQQINATPGPANPPIGQPGGYTWDDISVYLIGYEFSKGYQNCYVQYAAGYGTLSIPAWQANHLYSIGNLITDTNGNVQLASFAGTSGATQPTWPTIPLTQTVDGTGGLIWILAYQGSPPPLPLDLAQAVCDVVALKYQEKSRIGLKEINITEGASTQYLDDIPKATMRVLNLYRRTSGLWR